MFTSNLFGMISICCVIGALIGDGLHSGDMPWAAIAALTVAAAMCFVGMDKSKLSREAFDFEPTTEPLKQAPGSVLPPDRR